MGEAFPGGGAVAKVLDGLLMDGCGDSTVELIEGRSVEARVFIPEGVSSAVA